MHANLWYIFAFCCECQGLLKFCGNDSNITITSTIHDNHHHCNNSDGNDDDNNKNNDNNGVIALTKASTSTHSTMSTNSSLCSRKIILNASTVVV